MTKTILYDPLNTLLAEVPEGNTGVPRMSVVFDEAANLYTKTKAADLRKEIRHVALRRVWRAMMRLPAWMIFMSTNSKIEVFARAQDLDPSGKIAEGELARITPFLGLQLNLEAAYLSATYTDELFKPLSEYFTITHLTMIGHPIWWLHCKSTPSELRAFVLDKLFCGQNFNPLTRIMFLAH